MTISDRKKREKQALKSKILAQAEKLMAEEGIENLSMRKIANGIDYSPTTIYRFFKDKESLLSTIVSRNHAEITKRFQTISQNESLDPLDKLKLLVSEYIRFGLEYQNTYRLYTQICKFEVIDQGLHETIGGERYRIFISWQNQVEALINAGLIRGTDSLSVIILIWHVTHGFISNRIGVKEIHWKSDEEEINGIIELIFNGIIIK